ncbi:MAG: transposase [bacterium]|nr:transposase [bacterium]
MKERYTRKNSLRLQRHDYRHPRTFFVTICVEGRHKLFGEVVNATMLLNEFGEAVKIEWKKTAEIREAIWLDEFMIMPNHFHAILRIDDTYIGPFAGPARNVDVGADGNPPAPSEADHSRVTVKTTYARTAPLSTIIAAFKRATTKRINEIRGTKGVEVWQRSFYDRIIRNERELGLARQYIMDNPLNWELDKENPDLQGVYWEE